MVVVYRCRNCGRVLIEIYGPNDVRSEALERLCEEVRACMEEEHRGKNLVEAAIVCGSRHGVSPNAAWLIHRFVDCYEYWKSYFRYYGIPTPRAIIEIFRNRCPYCGSPLQYDGEDITKRITIRLASSRGSNGGSTNRRSRKKRGR